MKNSDTNLFSRLTSSLMQLQTRRVITSASIAEKFWVSIRTIYRDIKALIEAGVPIFTADGKGYSLVEGYKIPPVCFRKVKRMH